MLWAMLEMNQESPDPRDPDNLSPLAVENESLRVRIRAWAVSEGHGPEFDHKLIPGARKVILGIKKK